LNGFKKYRVLTQNLMGLAFGFTEKCLFAMKIGQKSIFHSHQAHILSQLDIIVLYTIFLRFKKKYRVSAQNPKGLAFGFTEKTYVPDKNRLKIHISSL
jgi:hypothetical protein